MDRYFYFSSFLEYLSWNSVPPSEDGFVRNARQWLSREDFRILMGVDIEDLSFVSKENNILRRWKEFELRLRTELLGWRKEKKEPPAFMQEALNSSNPLEVEIALLKLRWDFLDSLEFGHFFDIEYVIIYFLKLQILQRLKSFDKDKGKKIFESMLEEAQ